MTDTGRENVERVAQLLHERNHSPDALDAADLLLALLERAEKAELALTDDALVREIALQLRPYEPICAEKVTEMLDDIRRGIRLYVDARAALAPKENNNG